MWLEQSRCSLLVVIRILCYDSQTTIILNICKQLTDYHPTDWYLYCKWFYYL
uniref:Uncharacterized protein n=1 Tax=Arundo donax TaxID=35708 RepID=A0A0A9C4E4_ARUDO